MRIHVRNGRIVKTELGAKTREVSREEVLGRLFDFAARAVPITRDQIEQAAKEFGEVDALLSAWPDMLKAEGLLSERPDGKFEYTREGITFGAKGWRALSKKRGSRAKKIERAEDKIDREIEKAWYRLASGVQVPIMDIPRIFRDIKLEVAGGMDIDTAVRAAIHYYQVGGETADLPENVSIKEVLGGGFMILIDGIQWGEMRDRSGAGSRVFATWNEAARTAREISRD